MTCHDRELPGGGTAAKLRVLRARRLFGHIAGRVADPVEARRIEADLNDAWLRLQLALAADDPVLARSQRRACRSLMGEAMGRAGRG